LKRRHYFRERLRLAFSCCHRLSLGAAVCQEVSVAVKEFDELVNEFADSVMAQKDAIRRGDVKAGNRHHDRGTHAWNELRARGDEGRDALATLLTDDRPDVRAMAAACLLKHRTREAKRVLKEVAKGEGLAAFGASQALQRWKEGDWHLDPD
jgi:hypothetical protein